MSEFGGTLKLLLKLEWKFPFLKERESAPDVGAIISITKLVWKVLGSHMEAAVSFAPS